MNPTEKSKGHRNMGALGDVNDARDKVLDLKDALKIMHERDPDQEVWERAYPPIDAALRLAYEQVRDDPVAREIRELFSPETVAEGREVRVADILPTVFLLAGILTRRAHKAAMGQPGATRRRGATGLE